MNALDEIVRHFQLSADGEADKEFADKAAADLAQLRQENADLRKAVEEARIIMEMAVEDIDLAGAVCPAHISKVSAMWLEAHPAQEGEA
jgi:lipopolysaccharide biosynthesis regulator YciM